MQQVEQTVAANIALIASPQGGKHMLKDATVSSDDEANGLSGEMVHVVRKVNQLLS
jgi:hypothetical protein